MTATPITASEAELTADEISMIHTGRRNLAIRLEDTRRARSLLKIAIDRLAPKLTDLTEKDVPERLADMRSRLEDVTLEELQANAALEAFNESHLSTAELERRAGQLVKTRARERSEKIKAEFRSKMSEGLELVLQAEALFAEARLLLASAPQGTMRDLPQSFELTSVLNLWPRYTPEKIRAHIANS